MCVDLVLYQVMVPNFVIFTLLFLFPDNFSVIRCNKFFELTKKPYFVDKSLLLKKYFSKESEAVIANNRNKDGENKNLNYYYVNYPRGFGKTTNLKMIRSFAEFESTSASINYSMKPYHQTKAHDVFKKLKIYNYNEIISQHMNQYGVILLDLNFEPDELRNETIAERSFVAKLSKSFQSYEWLGDHGMTSRAMHTVNEIITGNISSIHVYRSLYYMAKIIDKYNPKGIILLVDNFDSAARAYVQRPNLAVKFLYKLMYKTIDKLLEINVPSGDDFHKRCLCLVTGITSLYFESINFKYYGSFKSVPFLTRGFFSQYFGFVQEDVDVLLARYNCTSSEKTAVANYYRGYTAEDTESSFYNPISVIEYMKSKQTSGVGKLDPYWARNESIDFIVEFAKSAFFRDKLKELCTLNSFRVPSPFKNIDPNMFISFLESSSRNYEEMLEDDVPALLHYLYDHGFLKHATKFVWLSFAFATFEVKTEVKRRLEEKGLKFEK